MLKFLGPLHEAEVAVFRVPLPEDTGVPTGMERFPLTSNQDGAHFKIIAHGQKGIEHLGLTHESDILNNTRSTRTNALMRWLCWQMPYHTAHHSYPSVPFWQLRKLNDKIENAAGEVHRMGWIEFQVEVMKRLMQKDESQWPMDDVWIVPAKGGRQVRLEA